MEWSVDRIIGVVGIVLAAIAIGVGLGMDTRTQGELRFVQGCFIFSALALFILIVFWAIHTDAASIRGRVIVGVVSALIIGACLVGGLRWANGRYRPQEPVALVPVLIEWDDPMPIIAGMPLSSIQLNAKANVGADPSYSPGIGKILAVGSHPLTVTFTPKDTTRYKPTSKTVHLVVNAPVPISPRQPQPQDDQFKSALAFEAYVENMGNLPARKRLTLTYDDKPWNETKYGDVRLEIENTSTVPLENLDLDIDLLGNKSGDVIAGIGQLGDVGGVEFHKPQLPEAKVRLTGKDGKDYIVTSTDIMDAGHPLFFDVRVFCPRLSQGETLRLIIAAFLDDPSKRPNHLRIKGTYETAPSEGSRREKVEKIVDVVQ